jgi:hypothetical protein
MRKVVLAAALAVLAAGGIGCSSGYSSMGYLVTDDGLPGCAFRYGYYPYYDASGAGKIARMDVLRVERLRFPRIVNRDNDSLADRLNAGSSNPGASPEVGGKSSPVVDRAPILPAAPPPPPRVVAPR